MQGYQKIRHTYIRLYCSIYFSAKLQCCLISYSKLRKVAAGEYKNCFVLSAHNPEICFPRCQNWRRPKITDLVCACSFCSIVSNVTKCGNGFLSVSDVFVNKIDSLH